MYIVFLRTVHKLLTASNLALFSFANHVSYEYLAGRWTFDIEKRHIERNRSIFSAKMFLWDSSGCHLSSRLVKNWPVSRKLSIIYTLERSQNSKTGSEFTKKTVDECLEDVDSYKWKNLIIASILQRICLKWILKTPEWSHLTLVSLLFTLNIMSMLI